MRISAPSPRRQLAELKHPNLAEYVRAKRAAGESWRRIERAVYRHTNGDVDVTFETLRAWFPDSEVTR